MSTIETAPAASGLVDVRARLRRACQDVGRVEDAVKLICVSKGFGHQDILPIIEAGERAFGENRVQEAVEKWPNLSSSYPDIELHLIGPLQSNKADAAVALFDVIQTLDRPKIAMAVSAAMRKTGRKPKCFVQVNTGEELQKSGVFPRDLSHFLQICRDEANLDISGLMCIPPVDQLASPHFALLNELAREFQLRELSMGMSADFELAVQMGATLVRVGSAIFGERRQYLSPMKI
ncbi:YggS family pyridoxal phosphate-dependent enzyme [Rhodoblastus acidophilus]|uniref:YggS family pyridoxal phosphate-dependent enzyme n=1 Tax=Candidatus Rhodoblastus alkanivorans TaxID=2954117 RepID=UPI001FAA4C6E|nr:YggS family pyridoxal phosphate-dependent enzyme [Candidatus Rhodoblastus alkanivorans]MCI4679943.1 YggS family pyridoxal phosphate-dependent enzyme [Candidatus Rhodoblastus alkanivorans]MDI4642530.1 YggS family pyridoxal phosphate-dependent enzyme [Rhodoblastus acidophilus]